MKRVQFLCLALFCVFLGGAAVWRASLPNNRFHPTRDYFVIKSDAKRFYILRWLHEYDDVTTVVTVHNFLRDGLSATHWLPNRGSFPMAEFFDRNQDQCEHARAGSALQYRAYSRWVPLQSINGDCIYTHFPPLAYWIYTAVAWLGFHQFFHYKILALTFNLAFIGVFHQWLRREVGGGAALIGALVLGTTPAFLSWVDALYYQPFHFLLLFLGLLAWSAYLRTAARRHAWLTWLCFFAQSLISYDLILFMGVAIVGVTVAEHGFQRARHYWRGFLLQFTAPIAAFMIQLCLRISLFGLARTLANARTTAIHRMTSVPGDGLSLLLGEISKNIMPWSLVAAALLTFAGVRWRLRVPMRREWTLVGTLFVGAWSFIAFMPGTALFHHMVTFRYFLPFMIYSLVLALDASLRVWAHWTKTRRGAGQRRERWSLAVAAVLPLGLLLAVAWQNAEYVVDEVRGNLDSNRSHEPLNLARRALDALYWVEEGRPATSPPHLPLSGKRVNEPRRWLSDFRIIGPAPSHYEVWWLEPQPVRTVRLLVDQKAAAQVAEHCFVSAFQNGNFLSLKAAAAVTVNPFEPGRNDTLPRVPYAWVEYDLPSEHVSRSIRLTCSGMQSIALRQWEAYAQGAPGPNS